MSAQRAAAAYDNVIRRLEFIEAHPRVRIEFKRAPVWRWEAEWTRHDDQPQLRVHVDLGKLLDTLDVIDWEQERPKRPPSPPLRPPGEMPPPEIA